MWQHPAVRYKAREICSMSHILIVIQILEDKVLEKERELQAEGIQRDQLIQEKLDVCDSLLFFFLLLRTPLERCCVHNMSPFISSSGLSPGSCEAKVQRAKVCLNCTEPSVARSSCWSLPVRRYLSDTCCKCSVVVLVR